MDGSDSAVADIHIDHHRIVLTPLGHAEHSYSEPLRDEITSALPPALTTLESVCRIDTGVGQEFVAASARANAGPGAGAPFVAILDDYLLRERHFLAAALNLGGIANVTVYRQEPLKSTGKELFNAEHITPAYLTSVEELGIDIDAKEAYLFALLGFLSWHSIPATLPCCTGATGASVAGRGP